MVLNGNSILIRANDGNGGFEPIGTAIATRIEAVHGEDAKHSGHKWGSPSWSLSCEAEITPAISDLFESLDNIREWMASRRMAIFFSRHRQ